MGDDEGKKMIPIYDEHMYPKLVLTRNLKTIRAEVSKNQKHLCDFIQSTKTAIIKAAIKIKLIKDIYWIV